MKTPRLITIGLILLFSLPIAMQHFVYILVEDRGVSSQPSESEISDRRRLRQYINAHMGLFNWLERVDYDLQLRASSPGKMSPNVAVVEIGEQSLKDLGQFPFNRKIYRNLIERLDKAGAKVVAFDAAFPERDSSIETIDELRKIRHEVEQEEGFDSRAVQHIDARIFALDADEDFATALHETRLPVVLGFTLTAGENVTVAPEVKDMLFGYGMYRRSYLDTSSLNSYEGRMPVLSLLQITRSLNKASSVGHINPELDDDSVIRAIPAVLEFEGHVFGSLALRAIAAYYGEEPILDGEGGTTVRGITRDANGDPVPGKMAFPLGVDGMFRLRYYGRDRTFPYVEFSDIVKDRLAGDALKRAVGGKIVFVGATAQGLKDLRDTPISATYPGVETHATMASNVLEGSFLLRDQRFFFFGYLLVIAASAISSWAVFRFNPLYSFLVALGAAAGTQGVVHWACYNRGVIVPSLLPSASALSVFFAGVLFRYFTEEREKKVVRAAFSRYVSSAVVDEILRDQTKLRLGGQKRELTVMFVDLVEFTRLTEHLDATFVTQLLNEYFTRMTNILLRNKGTLDKYMGDGLMCFWGAPLELPDHAHLACVTAIEMRQELLKINQEWKAKHGISIESRIGVNTGVVAVGNMGSDQVFSYTVMGDHVNLGSRLEGVNTVYGTHIVVSAATAEKAGEGFLFRPLDRVQVKGREDFVDILELVGMAEAREPEWVHTFRTALKHYQAAEWEDAESSFGACLSLKPGDGPSQVFLERIRDFRIVEPEDWAGVWKLSSK